MIEFFKTKGWDVITIILMAVLCALIWLAPPKQVNIKVTLDCAKNNNGVTCSAVTK